MAQILTISIANRVAELPRLAQAVDAFLERQRLPREAIDAVELALDELVANVVLWGHDDGREHLVHVRAAVDESQVRIVIEDDGRPFDPLSVPPPDVLRAPQDRAEGGLGIHLVRSLVDEVTYQRVGGRNVVEFKVAADPLRLCPPTSD